MASAVGGAPAVRTLRIVMEDDPHETAPVIIPLDGAATDADVALIVDDYAALSDAVIKSATVTDQFAITGFATAGKPAAGSLVAKLLAMEFRKDNPVNSANIITKQVILPSYILALRNDEASPIIPVTDNATYNALWALLQSNLDVVGADGVHYPGGWSYNPSSKFGTKATVTDGL